MNDLGSIQLAPVSGGTVCGGIISAGSLWEKKPVLFYIIRRTGCVLCREAALELSSRFDSGEYNGAQLIGIIKKVESKDDIKTNKYYGVEEFQTNYFMNNPVYLDINLKFYEYFGNHSVLSQGLSSWNPFKLYADIVAVNTRLRNKQITGNLTGEL